MMAGLKRLIDKLLMRNVTYELREEVGQMRSEMAQVLRSLRSLETDMRRINSNVAFLMQDVSVGQEGLADQILEARRETHLAVSEIRVRMDLLQPVVERLAAEDQSATFRN